MEPYLRLSFGAQAGASKPGMKQIVETIRAQVQAQPALAGCRLPPIRVLAHQLGVSKNTVTAAYEELQAQCLVESKSRQGLFVAESPELVSVGQHEKAGSTPARALTAKSVSTGSLGQVTVPQIQFKPVTAINPALTGSPEMITLSSVFVDPALLPREKMAACFKSVLKTPGLKSFADRQGYLPLRRKIAQRLRRRGIEVDVEHIVTTVGSQQALDIVCRSLANRKIATENPAYYVGKSLFELNQIEPIGLPIEPFGGIDREKWETSIAIERPGMLYLTTNFQNPTGYSYTSAELMSIIEWSRKYGFGILEDDWGSDMLSFSEFRPSLRGLGGPEVLYMNSFTKKLLPSMRVGYVVGSESTVDALVHAKRVTVSGVPTVVEAALFEFLDRGYYDAHLKNIQKELDIRYQHCLEALGALMPPGVRWTLPGGGPILWLELPPSVNIDRLVERMASRKVLVQPSQGAFFGSPHLHGFKIGYAFISTQDMRKALELLADAIRPETRA